LFDPVLAHVTANTGTGSSRITAKAPPRARCHRVGCLLAGSGRRATDRRVRLTADR
jgi:hypothetical protein